MKKKISCFILLILIIISLSSCSLFSSLNEDTDYGLDDSIDTVEVTTTYSKVYSKIYSSCFGVRNNVSTTSYKIGSCVCIKTNSSSSYFLTNRHVLEKDDNINVSSNLSIYFGNSEYYSASVVYCSTYNERIADESCDLAILKISTPISKSITAVEIGDDIVSKGQDVLAVGCPYSLQFYNSLTVGVVSKVNSSSHLIQHQATINPGNSGGGLFNLSGRLIGINVSKLSPNDEIIEGIGFAIDVGRIRSFLSNANFSL